MNKGIITVKEKTRENSAGPKAKEDIETVLTDSSFRKINFFINSKSKLQKFLVAKVKVSKTLQKDNSDEYVLQYPTYSKIVIKEILKYINKNNKRLIIIVHDVEALRREINDKSYIEREINTFNMADGLIVHNDLMLEWLKKHGVKKPMVSLEIFDYLSPHYELKRQFDKSICFAGNLAKANFLTKLQFNKVKLHVFGPNPAKKYNQNIIYDGQYTPEELPKHLKYNFGLVWDGDKVNECSGTFGRYTMYNNPHKVSLYLSSGMPVIIWRKAAMSRFIEENDLGLTINSLNELENKLSNLSEADYQQMLTNVNKISEKLHAGHFTKTAVKKIEDKLGKTSNVENL